MLFKNSAVLHDYSAAADMEYLETNGLGGWCSSSLAGSHTRRYHGLLVAATAPPAERMSLVSKMDETIVIGAQRFELGTNRYGDIIQPQGYRYATRFEKGLFPVFTYDVGPVQLEKTWVMLHAENTVVVVYRVLKAAQEFVLDLCPLFSVRNYHHLVQANDAINREAGFINHVLRVRAYNSTPEIFIQLPGGQFRPAAAWYYGFTYSIEKYRGLECSEDLFCYGTLTTNLREGDEIYIIVSTTNPEGRDAAALVLAEEKRRQQLSGNLLPGSMHWYLTQAADQFIVQRSIPASGNNPPIAAATIIAGYHWFTDWSRDTMISLPGLTLATGRFDDAKKILEAFAGSVSMGMLPNRFTDDGSAPEYNTVDGTLWYFVAVYKYLQATGDDAFVLNQLLPVLKDIVQWHFKGTRYHIHVSEDGLLYSGEKGQQLTWMDARIGDWVVTARMGKPVEIQGLWYNALRMYASLLERAGEAAEAAQMNSYADAVHTRFNQLYWNTPGGYLYDNIDENGQPDAQLRPNQLFAISLPFALLEGGQAVAVVEKMTALLYTPVGLRSLAPDDPAYAGQYGGSLLQRDAAYHQGTVWGWLLGPYIDAIVKTNLTTGYEHAQKILDAFAHHLDEGCIGTVAEIFDADIPHHPRGCAAQAWSVAELLRVIHEYQLNKAAFNTAGAGLGSPFLTQ